MGNSITIFNFFQKKNANSLEANIDDVALSPLILISSNKVLKNFISVI